MGLTPFLQDIKTRLDAGSTPESISEQCWVSAQTIRRAFNLPKK